VAIKLKSLGKFNRIYLSLDGIYNQLNPATFYNSESNKYLGEEMELYLLSTTKELTETPVSSLNKKKALLIGDPDFRLDNNTEPKTPETETTRSYHGTIFTDLPGTDKELKSINSTLTAFGWKTQVFSRKDAGEDKIKQFKYPSLVHIATHGFFLGNTTKDVTTPMLSSGIALAGVNARPENKKQEDGVLTAYESMNLQLDSTELVVLSACETGLGETKTGEGVYGIQRGLRVSGAKTIIMSLWKVDDTATQELMSNFYKEWIATGNKHTAFHKAQAIIKKKYIYPYYWGAFVMVGE
jgi:CHAT domain-containing protein